MKSPKRVMNIVKFFENFRTIFRIKRLSPFQKQKLQPLISADNVTHSSEWGLIIDLLPSTDDKGLILTVLSLRDALGELHQHEKDQFDFYN